MYSINLLSNGSEKDIYTYIVVKGNTYEECKWKNIFTVK